LLETALLTKRDIEDFAYKGEKRAAISKIAVSNKRAPPARAPTTMEEVVSQSEAARAHNLKVR